MNGERYGREDDFGDGVDRLGRQGQDDRRLRGHRLDRGDDLGPAYRPDGSYRPGRGYSLDGDYRPGRGYGTDHGDQEGWDYGPGESDRLAGKDRRPASSGRRPDNSLLGGSDRRGASDRLGGSGRTGGGRWRDESDEPRRGHRLDAGRESVSDRVGAGAAASSGGGSGDLDGGPGTGTSGGGRGRRQDGLRRVRHMSNWTAAALLAGTGVATVALATHAMQSGTTATTSASGASTQGTAVKAGAPHVGGSVVTSGGSGATVTTTTKVVNGHVVVTKVRHPAVWHDN